MGRKRKNRSNSATAGSIPEAAPSEAIEPSSSAIRGSENRVPVPLDTSNSQEVKKAVDKKSLSMLNKLYYFCTRRPKAHEELSVLVSMFGVYLNRKDGYTMKPKGWVNDMVILAAGKIMMEEEKATNGVVTRHMFSPQFVNKVICDLNQSNEDSYKPWCIEDVSLFILPSKLGYDINQCKLIFAPTLFEEHWSCYAFEPKDKIFHDCGIYVLKYMEIWDGSIKWQDKTMPDYQRKEILKFRQSLICGWVQHPKNEVREELLKAAGLWGKLC
ncbi:hypothetical protein GmHk_20G058536 [Glycine max]|nr:hypothetical protein GmHk_20G058536 [Glycine max]